MIVKENNNSINLVPKDIVLNNLSKYIQEVQNNPMLPLVTEDFVLISKDFYDILIKNLNKLSHKPDVVSITEIDPPRYDDESYGWKEIRL